MIKIDNLKEGKKEVFSIFRRIKNKDFSGNAGQAVKNLSYQLAQNLIFKVGSLYPLKIFFIQNKNVFR